MPPKAKQVPKSVVVNPKSVAKPTAAATSASKQTATASTLVRPASASNPAKHIEGDLKTVITAVTASPKPNEPLHTRCALVIDEMARAATFFRHRDVNYLNAFEKEAMSTECIRLGILGAIRYGKSIVIDLMDNSSLLNIFRDGCNTIDAEVFPQLLNRSIIKEEKFMRLARPSDGDDYNNKWNYADSIFENFQTLFLFSGPEPSEELLRLGVTYKIVS